MRRVISVLVLMAMVAVANLGGCDCGTPPPSLPELLEVNGEGGGIKDGFGDDGEIADDNEPSARERLGDQEVLSENDSPPEDAPEPKPDLFPCRNHPNFGQPCEKGVGECLQRGIYSLCKHLVPECDASIGLPKIEVCDGKDNDCNGQIDDGLAPRLCANQQGVCKGSIQTCNGENGWSVCTPDDLREQSVGFEQKEVSCDGLDNDCNNQVDDGLKAPLCANQLGVCKGALRRCGGTAGWQACDQVRYAAHSADYESLETKCDQLDNDCDGTVDEGCACSGIATRACGVSANGVCKMGTQSCGTDGKWGECQGAVNPSQEVCDGLDNDCDGQIDDGLIRPLCGNQKGECKGALASQCNGAQGWAACVAADYQKNVDYEVAETKCDGKDNDCDGKIDNNLQAPVCANQNGVCKGAVKICGGANGWLACASGNYFLFSEAYEEKETRCDGLDNDCDGQIDNIAQAPLCVKQQGVCKGARQKCGGKSGWQACSDSDYASHSSDYQPDEQSKCDTKDNDCDGAIDENCSCVPPQTRACGDFSVGVCKQGMQSCQPDGTWGNCIGNVNPLKEECDGRDNDCDGQIDNIPLLDYQRCANQKGVCAGSLKTCGGTQGWKACTEAEWSSHSSDYESSETRCDGLDNNCDGQIDNIASAPNCANQNGVCKCATKVCWGKLGWQNCSISVYQGQSDYETVETKCDGKDNDCDGQIDNIALAPLCPKQQGVCKGAKAKCLGASGWEQCSDATYLSHSSVYESTETKCDKLDNDCDGAIDASCSGCTAGVQRACGLYSTPPCKLGVQTCQSNRTWGSCVGVVNPQNEVCDGIDNDCNGKVDDVLPSSLPLCPRQKGVCLGSRRSCSQSFCNSATYRSHSSSYEVNETKCDGKDNDCDGVVDENCTP